MARRQTAPRQIHQTRAPEKLPEVIEIDKATALALAAAVRESDRPGLTRRRRAELDNMLRDAARQVDATLRKRYGHDWSALHGHAVATAEIEDITARRTA